LLSGASSPDIITKLVQECELEHSKILEELHMLATPEKEKYASSEAAVRRLKNLTDLVRKIENQVNDVRNDRNRSCVQAVLKNARLYRARLRMSSRKADKGGVENSWEAKEVLLTAHPLLSDVATDIRIILALEQIPYDERPVQLEMAVRTWDSMIEDNLGSKIRALSRSEVVFKDSRLRFSGGELMLYVTIISVGANLATIADIIYRYLKKHEGPQKTSASVESPDGTAIHLEGLPPDEISKIFRMSLQASISGRQEKRKARG